MFSTAVIIDDILPRSQFIAIAAQTIYSCNWTANYTTDVIVYSRTAAAPVNDVTHKLLTSQYNVTFIGSLNDVRVTLITPSTAGDIITIVRATPADRENLYTNTNFLPSMLNQDFGILTLVDQQNQLVNQQVAPRYNYSAIIQPVIDTILPILDPLSSWRKNQNNTAIEQFQALDVTTATGIKFIIQQPSIFVPSAQAMSLLATGITKNATATGVQSIAVLGVDYYGPGQTVDIPVDEGGTSRSNAIPYSVITGGTTATGAHQSVADVGTLNFALFSNGAGVLPSWKEVPVAVGAPLTRINDTNVTMTFVGNTPSALVQAVEIQVGWTGILAETRGGTGNNTYTLGDMLYSSAPNTLAKITGNATIVKQYLSQTGDGVNSASPIWSTINGNEIIGAALTKVDDTNVTLTLAGNPATSLLRATALSLGWTGELSLTRGGTNANLTAALGGVVFSNATGLQISTPLTNGQLLVGSTGLQPVPTVITAGSNISITNAAGSITINATASGAINAGLINELAWYATAGTTLSGLATLANGVLITNNSSVPSLLANSGTPGFILTANAGAPPSWEASPGPGITPAPLTKVDDTNVTLTLGGQPAIALLHPTSLTLGWTGLLDLSRGGTNANLTPSNGGIVWSNATQLQIITAAGSAGRMLRSGGAGAPTWSTATFPDTTTINQILYSSAGNVVAGLATANSGILSTSAGGVPAINTPATVAALFTKPTSQVFLSGSGTYTTPANCRWLKVRMVGAGAGGQGNSVGGIIVTTSTVGGDTNFGAGIAGGGKVSLSTNWPVAAGGTASGGIQGAAVVNTIHGGSSGGGNQNNGSGTIGQLAGGAGGASAFGGGGGSSLGAIGSAGTAYGSGGAGAGTSANASYVSGSGGGAGAYMESIVQTPSATYAYTVGAGGAAGLGTNHNGGAGAVGLIIVEEYYI